MDILWGSTPCQAFSASGQREGLSDVRGQLTMKFVELADQMNPGFVAWENVKGVLNDEYNAFGCFLGALAGEDGPLQPPGGRWTHAGYVCGPKRAIAWRLFDAQHSGVPQRRQRIFLVACPRSGADPREILFEREGTRWNTSSVPKQQQDDAARIGDGSSIVEELTLLTPPCYINTDARPKISTRHAYTLKADQGSGGRGSIAHTMMVDGTARAVVRRLMPEECETLMGMPRGHTRIPYNGKPSDACPDTNRWKALGNSLVVNEVRWIGERIKRANTALNTH